MDKGQNRRMRIFADENVPPKAFKAFSQLCKCNGSNVSMCIHTNDVSGLRGSPDDKLVEYLIQSHWNKRDSIVISGDIGSKTKSGDPKLPALLPALGINSVYWPGSSADLTGFQKIRSLIVVLPKLVERCQVAGMNTLRLKIYKSGDSFKIHDWPILQKS